MEPPRAEHAREWKPLYCHGIRLIPTENEDALVFSASEKAHVAWRTDEIRPGLWAASAREYHDVKARFCLIQIDCATNSEPGSSRE